MKKAKQNTGKNCNSFHLFIAVVSHYQVALTIEQFAMIHSHACNAANELEVGQVILIT